MPIIEPEVSINSPDKAGAEEILLAEITKHLDALPQGAQVMLKLTIPDVPDLYSGLVNAQDGLPGLSHCRAATRGPTPASAWL